MAVIRRLVRRTNTVSNCSTLQEGTSRRVGDRRWPVVLESCCFSYLSLPNFEDGDTLCFFNYRSDRMQEIATVLGHPEKPMEVEVRKDIFCSFRC